MNATVIACGQAVVAMQKQTGLVAMCGHTRRFNPSHQFVHNKIKAGEAAILVDLQRKGMQVVIPDAESFRAKARPAVEELFKKEWPVTTWQEVLAY